MRVIDLSHEFASATYAGRSSNGQPALEITPLSTVAGKGVASAQISLNNHIGTHLDAPSHLIEGGAGIGDVPLDVLCGPAVVLNLPKLRNEAVTAADLQRAEPRIQRGDIVLIATGWADRLGDPEYASHHPFIDEGAATWLADTGARLVGMDVQSVDLPHSLRPSGFHYTSLRILLSRGIPVLHTIRNLDEITGKRVTVFCLPVNFGQIDGSPVRVVAQLE